MTTPHTAEALAEQLNPAGTHSLAYCAEAAAMLRALAQENALLHERHAGDNKLYAEQAQEIERLTVERDALMAANRDCMLHFDTLKADYDRLRKVAQQALEALMLLNKPKINHHASVAIVALRKELGHA